MAEGRVWRSRADLRAIFQRLVYEYLMEEGIPEEQRFEGLKMAMRSHGLPYDPKQLDRIRKSWLACVADPPHRRKKP